MRDIGSDRPARSRIRWERDPALHLAFLSLGCAVITWRYLQQF